MIGNARKLQELGDREITLNNYARGATYLEPDYMHSTAHHYHDEF